MVTAPAPVAPNVAPGSALLGVMLPVHAAASPADARRRVVRLVAPAATCRTSRSAPTRREVVARLGGIADLFLVHDRPIVRHVDDSIVRVMLGRELVLRRARGYAPLPVDVGWQMPPTLAVGGT